MKRVFIALFFLMLLVPVYSTEHCFVVEAQASDFLDGMQVTDEGTFNPGKANSKEEKINYKQALDKYKEIISFFTGILTVTSFAAMIWNFAKLSMAGDNEQERKRAIISILFCGIGVALMGSATIIIGFFWNIVK